MIQGSLSWVAESVGGSLGGAAREFRGVCTDTRELRLGEIFFCLRGKSDGHDYLEQAQSLGAAGAVVERGVSSSQNLPKEFPLIEVPDTLRALGDLALSWRRRFAIPVLALTGSNGKTTTKNLLQTVFASRWNTLATRGNFNNLIGVPKTLFELNPEHEIAIVEMGMNDFGEIARLTEIASPTHALITHIGSAHLEKLGSIEGVARAKGELFAKLSPEAVAFVNLQDPRVAALPTAARRVPYGTKESGVWCELLGMDPDLELRAHLREASTMLRVHLSGAHHVINVLASLAVANHFGFRLGDWAKSLEKFSAPHSRMEVQALRSGRHLIDDCYNANPDSTRAALETLRTLKQDSPALAILGDMLELGEHATELHYAIGKQARDIGADQLIAIGQFSDATLRGARDAGMPADRLCGFPDVDSALRSLEISPETRWILVKGSRSNHLEKIVAQLKENA